MVECRTTANQIGLVPGTSGSRETLTASWPGRGGGGGTGACTLTSGSATEQATSSVSPAKAKEAIAQTSKAIVRRGAIST